MVCKLTRWMDGHGWVSSRSQWTVCAFEQRATGTLASPTAHAFPELNLRTYVKGPDGRGGVYFFSLDAASLLAVVGARVAFGLPYFLGANVRDTGQRRHRAFHIATVCSGTASRSSLRCELPFHRGRPLLTTICAAF